MNNSSESLPEHIKRVGDGKKLKITRKLDDLQRQKLMADGYELEETDSPDADTGAEDN